MDLGNINETDHWGVGTSPGLYNTVIFTLRYLLINDIKFLKTDIHRPYRRKLTFCGRADTLYKPKKLAAVSALIFVQSVTMYMPPSVLSMPFSSTTKPFPHEQAAVSTWRLLFET